MELVAVVHWLVVVLAINHGAPEKVYEREVNTRQECELIIDDLDEQPGTDPDEVVFSCIKVTRYVQERRA